MMKFLRTLLGPYYEALRSGQALRLGPFSLVRTIHLAGLMSKVSWLEREAAGYSSSTAATSVAKKRGVVFLHNSYYNFYYLAKALRERGWNAVSVSIEAPDGEHSGFYHGNDICLYDPDPFKMSQRINEFLSSAAENYGMVHFYGRSKMSFFPSEFDYTDDYSRWPFDIARLKQAGLKIGYSVCGCLDGVAQSSVHKWSGCCNRCVWQNNPKVCNDRGNLAWGHKVQLMCDLIASEGFPALDYQRGAKVYREPLTTALDPEFWHPDLEVPDQFRLTREPGELIVYHAVGNFHLRSKGGRNLKGTEAVFAAVDRLREEGVNVRLVFATNIPSTDVRFLQVQADVIVDQLNYGRYGATAREGMMLGRPTVCYIHRDEPEGEDRLESIEASPLVSASEATVYEVLRDLLSDEHKRQEIGRAGRTFALKWHSADACAARFEKVYDGLFGS